MMQSVFEIANNKTDVFFHGDKLRAEIGGVFESAVRFICDAQLYKTELWQEFVHQFSFNADDRNRGWRCEYWGKMMRGAAFVYAYTRDDKLYLIMENTVRDLLEMQDADGRISTYSPECEFSGWDMWGRKYVLLGMQYFYEWCRDEQLKKEIRVSMCRQADYIIDRVGEGKLPIDKTSAHWLGINAMSILEPIVRLYNLTKDKKYLGFAEHIVKTGFEGDAHIFALALEDELYPYQYPTTKAYEMMSCFEGLIEYYRVTRIEKYRTAAINFGRRVLESEISVIGCCGCTHELFDHTAYSQTDDEKTGIMQETCVSVTLMKMCGQLLRLTGDVRYADCIEKTFFNAYLGSLNTHLCATKLDPKDDYPAMQRVLPFDSYSPLRLALRGQKTGGLMRMDNSAFYGCCACIGAAGIGVLYKSAVLQAMGNICMNFYLPGEITLLSPAGRPMTICIEGDYPYDGEVRITLKMSKPEYFDLTFRIPEWSRNARIEGAYKVPWNVASGYRTVSRKWRNGDTIVLSFDMNTYAVRPDKGAPGEDKYIALRRGPIVLAADARLGYGFKLPIQLDIAEDGSVNVCACDAPEISDSKLCVGVKSNGEVYRLVDYASAGKTYDEASEMAAWLCTK